MAERRPAAASRFGPSPHGQPEDTTVRRTTEQPRRQAQGANALRTEAATRRVGHHDDLRNPRSDGGTGTVGGNRSHARRSRSPAGDPCGDLPSSPHGLRGGVCRLGEPSGRPTPRLRDAGREGGGGWGGGGG